MGNDREETQQSLVLETDSDSESDMPQLMEKENVSNRLLEVVKLVEVGIDPDEPMFVESKGEENLEVDQPGTNSTTISESLACSSMHRLHAMQLLAVMVVHSTPTPDQVSDEESDHGN